MSRVRILVPAIAALLLLLVAGVWLVPGLLDWNRYRDGIAELASARVGRPVHIGGAITLNLLPQPILTAADVAVEDDGDGIQLKARALRLRVGLGALLRGAVDARELTLQGAELRLPWPPPAGALAGRPPSWISGLRAEVEDGRLQVGALVLDHVEGTLSTDPETGTLSAAGLGQAGSSAWQFTARLTRPDHQGAAGLDISLDGQGRLRDTGGTFSGQLGADGALAGRVAGRGPDLSQLMAAPAVAWRGDGRLSASGGLAVADELALEIAGAPARGAVALRVAPAARLDLAIAAGRLDLDAWLPALLARPDAMRPALPTGIDLSAEAAGWAGGTLRRVRAAIDLNGDGVLLRDVAALLPGDALLDLSGQVTRDAAGLLQFAGPARIAAPDLRATLRWMQALWPGTSISIPDAAPRRAEMSARVAAAPGSLELTDLRGTLDGAALTGTAAGRTAPRPTLTANLALDRLALEGWFAEWGTPSLAGLDAALTRLRTLDAELRLQVGTMSWAGLPLGPSTLELETESSRVQLRRLEARPFGARFTASGQWGDGMRLSDGRLDLAAPDLAPLRRWAGTALGGRLPAALAALLRGPGTASVQASGPPDALTLRVAAELSDLRVEAQPVVNLSTQRAAGALTVHHPGAPRLLETLGFGGTADWLGDGSFSVVGQMAAAPDRLELTGTTLAAGAARATGHVTLENHRLTGQVTAETLPLPMVHARSPDPLPVDWLRDWQVNLRLDAAQILLDRQPVLQDAGAELVVDARVLRLTRLAAKAANGTIAGNATLDAGGDTPRLAVQAQATSLSVAAAAPEAAIGLVGGQLDATLDLSATGHSPAALLSTLSGAGAVRAQSGVLGGFNLAAAAAALGLPESQALAAARAALRSGTTPFATAEARLAVSRGVLTADGTLSGEAGTGTLTGTIDLPGAAQDLDLVLTPAASGAPALGLRVTGSLDAPTRTPELAALARFLAERPGPAP